MKKKVIMIGVVLIVCLGTVFYNMQKRNPYKSYNHLKTSEVLKVKEFNQYWVYFYSMDDQESMDSKNGIARLNKAVSNVYFVKIKDKTEESSLLDCTIYLLTYHLENYKKEWSQINKWLKQQAIRNVRKCETELFSKKEELLYIRLREKMFLFFDDSVRNAKFVRNGQK